MRTLMLGVLLVAAGVAAGQSLPASAPASGPASRRADLADRYVDVLHGFSIQPPANCERSKDPSTSRLVTWIHREPKSGAVDFTLTVQQLIESKKDVDLRVYSVWLGDMLKNRDRMKVGSAEVTTVGEKGAIDIRGVAAAGLWQRQVWVHADPGRFLVFVASGPGDAKASVAATLEAVLSTARFTDPEVAKAARKANLARGAKLLADLKPDQVKQALRSGQLWYMLVSDGQNVGFVARSESLTRQRDVDGYQVTIWTFLQRPKEPPHLAKQVLFASFDAKLDRWKEQRQLGAGGSDTDGYAEDGGVVGNAVICGIDRAGRIEQVKRSLPMEVPYLPRATGHMLGRLVDLSKPQAYSFATYTTSANDFDMRTFTVVAPEQINVGGKMVDVIRATDQVAADSEDLNVWLDEKGDVVRMALASWLTLEASTKADVVKAFPQAEAIIKATEKWAAQP